MRYISIGLWLVVPFLAGLAQASEASLQERDATLITDTGKLFGTLTSGQGAALKTAALILPGSGPTNRDGNGPNTRPNTLKYLAQELASGGLSNLRIDKRGIGQSAAPNLREEDLRFQSNVDDARAWVKQLKSDTSSSCVWLIGHSEGALVAELAAQENPDVCGLVLIAGPGFKAGDILREQLGKSLPKPLLEQANASIAELEQGRTVAAPPSQLMALFRPSVQPYLISWFALDPAEILAKLPNPVLILQGTHDIQVSVENAQRLAKAKPDAKLRLLPGVNHILKIAPESRNENIATYDKPYLPLAQGITAAILEFVKAAAAPAPASPAVR